MRINLKKINLKFFVPFFKNNQLPSCLKSVTFTQRITRDRNRFTTNESKESLPPLIQQLRRLENEGLELDPGIEEQLQTL